MSGYKAFEMTASLSDKAEVPHEKTKLSEKVKILSDKADDATTEVLGKKADELNEDYVKIEKLDVDDDKEASENDEDDELMMLRLIALKSIGHKNQPKIEEDDIKALDTKIEDDDIKALGDKADETDCEERLTEAP